MLVVVGATDSGGVTHSRTSDTNCGRKISVNHCIHVDDIRGLFRLMGDSGRATK